VKKKLLVIFLLLLAGPRILAEQVGSSSSTLPTILQNQKYLSDPILAAAQICGPKAQESCSPDNMGGKTMCGDAVAEMVECMGQSMKKKKCSGSCKRGNHYAPCPKPPEDCCYGLCGDGKDFIDCPNDQLKKCGYKQVNLETDSKKCDLPGAVRAFKATSTAAGAKHGHVEFVSGPQQYCSIYAQVIDHSWPRDQDPDGCWYPDPDPVNLTPQKPSLPEFN
jgi:hypothetical protein